MFGLTSGGDEDYIFCIFDIRLEGGGGSERIKESSNGWSVKKGEKTCMYKK